MFDLLTASFAAENFRLREDWESRQQALRQHSVLRDVSNTDFLQAVALRVTHSRKQTGGAAVSCKRKDVLNLQVAEYKLHAPAIQQGFIDAAKFLQEQKIFSTRDLPYGSQLVPLSAILAELGALRSGP